MVGPVPTWLDCKLPNYLCVLEQTNQLTKHVDCKHNTLVLFDVEEEEEGKFQAYRLMTSVSIPAFDRKTNRNNQTQLLDGSYLPTRIASLLGVAGTDVALDDIEKRAWPYKIGVNGYPFIVSNNGYILIHPDLRPVYQGFLKDNYNSVDFCEVELLDDGRGPREFSPEILQLREALVNHTTGSTLGLKIRYHYDDMKRVASEKHNYYYAPLTGTPFTMGIALPEGYGDFTIKVVDTIKTFQQKGINIADYFTGSNWKIHPEWLYCKYHHASHRTFSSLEEELLHFLEKMSSPDWKWSEQYEPLQEEVDPDTWTYLNSNDSINCKKKDIPEGEYYCDKDLMQLLVFDAQITDPVFRDERWIFRNKEEQELLEIYNVSLRFVATQSGLTRWEHVQENEDSVIKGAEFGDLHKHTIEEAWYKSAVLQHEIEKDSFVFSVPFGAGDRDDILVTGSHAIFPRDGGLEAPGSVVGLQFHHSNMRSRFLSITSKIHCPTCTDTCASEEWECYVIDNNGYVVVSENLNDTGRFFGEIEGAVMEAMKIEKIFRKIPIWDYQALRLDEVIKITSAASILMTPLYHLGWLIQWVIGEMIWLFYQTSLLAGGWSSASPFLPVEELSKMPNVTFIVYNESTPCDQKAFLYMLQQNLLPRDGVYKKNASHCSRPFHLRHIPYSNLVLVVVETLYPTCYRRLSVAPMEVYYNYSKYPCQKVQLNELPRRKRMGCFSDHPQEVDIKMCGDGNVVSLSLAALFLSSLVLTTVQVLGH